MNKILWWYHSNETRPFFNSSSWCYLFSIFYNTMWGFCWILTFGSFGSKWVKQPFHLRRSALLISSRWLQWWTKKDNKPVLTALSFGYLLLGGNVIIETEGYWKVPSKWKKKHAWVRLTFFLRDTRSLGNSLSTLNYRILASILHHVWYPNGHTYENYDRAFKLSKKNQQKHVEIVHH